MLRIINKSRFLPNQFQTSSRFFQSTLAFIETSNDGKLSSTSFSTLLAAQNLDKPITAVILGSNSSVIAENLTKDYKIEKLNKVIYSNDELFNSNSPEIITCNLVSLLSEKNGENFDNFVISSSNLGKNILPRVSAIMNYQPINDIIEIDPQNKNIFKRPIFAGNLIETIDSSSQVKKFISVRASAFPNSFESNSGNASNVTIEELRNIAKPENLEIKWEGNKIMESNRPDLNSAKTVIAGGRALKDKETFDKLLDPLADKLNAAIGATRAAVDNGLVDNSLQIGQTGKVVAPDLYIAIGVSGAIQHLAGMKNSKKVIAINNDPDAPIFKAADYYLEGDLNTIVPELTEKL